LTLFGVVNVNQVSGAPILQFHKGSVFYIDDGVFDVDTNTDEPLSKRLDKVAQKHSHVKHFLERSHSMTLKSVPSAPVPGAGAAPGAKTAGPAPSLLEGAPAETGPAFHLELAFASDCLYLRLPKTDFLESMREPIPSSIGECASPWWHDEKLFPSHVCIISLLTAFANMLC
jgi:hypothetical protein